PSEAEQAGFAGAVVFETTGEVGYGGAGAFGDSVEDVAGGGEAGFDADVLRVDGTRDDAADAGDQRGLVADRHDARGGANHVHHVADFDSCAESVPMRIEGADRDGDTGAEAKLFGPLGSEMAGDFVGRFVPACEFSTNSGESGVDTGEEGFGWE